MMLVDKASMFEASRRMKEFLERTENDPEARLRASLYGSDIKELRPDEPDGES
jgi:hypothetical protein